jgi:Lrp/AsnC family transcriptional regulator, leucine-responsive regulatory protein
MDRIDETDALILLLLQENGRMKRSRIADEVGLSIPSVSERMRKLKERGVLLGYHAHINAKRLHFDIVAYIRVMVDQSSHYNEFVEQAMKLDAVQEVHSITGEGSHILRIQTRNTTSLERLLSEVQSWPGVHGTSTSIVLSTFKDTRVVKVRATTLDETDLVEMKS